MPSWGAVTDGGRRPAFLDAAQVANPLYVEAVRALVIDRTGVRSGRPSCEISYKRGHQYLTVIANHDNGRVVWVAKGRNRAALQAFFDALGPER